MKETKQLKTWKSKFGKDYTDRSTADSNIRINAFKEMIGDLDIKTILEVGCNRGHNLATLFKINPNYNLTGIEPLEYAIKKAEKNDAISILKGDCFEIPFDNSSFDLVFTCGVLIHIAVGDLAQAIDEIYRVSKKYILVIEYWDSREITVHYRGYNDLLWKRDFQEIFLKQKPNLKYTDKGFWGKKQGFDDCHWWLFEKREN